MNAFQPINVDFDQQSLYNDLMSTDMFDKSFLATVIYTDGRSNYDKDGYFYFVDRLKRMINVSGLKVWPAEVEAILHSHPAILEACFVGDSVPRTGDRVRAVVVLNDKEKKLSKDSFIEWCGKNMAHYKVPKSLEIRTNLPRGSAGKVLWKDL